MVAAYIQDSGARLGYQVKFITIGAENLLPQQAEVIERAFGVKPIQHYGMAEGVANISECPSGALHVDEDFSAVEFVEDALSGSLRVIGTNFTNLATPLLRYDVGDRVTIHPSASCACGRPGRVVQQIDGRAEDYIVLTNGARLGRLDHVFKDMVNVREAQLYQPKVGVVVVRLVRGDRFSDADETLLIAEFRRRLDRDTKIELDYRDSLPRSKSGKLKFVVSDVAPSDRLGHLAS